MENWHLFCAAFVLSLVDLSVLGAFLWYQLSAFYFAWHLCPMIVNRFCELVAFVCTGGMLPSLFAVVQVPLSLFSTTVYANYREHVQNKLLIAVYCTLLVYELLVALLMVRIGCYLKYPNSRMTHLHRDDRPANQQLPQPYIAFHMFALFTQPTPEGCSYALDSGNHEASKLEGFVTVQQPDGRQVMLGKVLQSKLEVSENVKVSIKECDGEVTGADLSICIHPLSYPNDSIESSDSHYPLTDVTHVNQHQQISEASTELNSSNSETSLSDSVTETELNRLLEEPLAQNSEVNYNEEPTQVQSKCLAQGACSI